MFNVQVSIDCDLTLDELVKSMKVDKKSLEIKKPSDLIK